MGGWIATSSHVLGKKRSTGRSRAQRLFPAADRAPIASRSRERHVRARLGSYGNLRSSARSITRSIARVIAPSTALPKRSNSFFWGTHFTW